MSVVDREAAIVLARAEAEARGWPFAEPLAVSQHGKEWHVMTNALMRGGNVNIWLDARTGAVVRAAWARR